MSSGEGARLPPGYADANQLEVEPPGLRPATLVAAHAVVTGVLLAATSRELLIRAPHVYWSAIHRDHGPLWASAVVGAALGAAVGFRSRGGSAAALSLAGAGIAAAATGALWSWGFAEHTRLPRVAALACLIGAGCVAHPAVACFRWLRADARALEVPLRLLTPSRLAASAAILGLVFAASAALPPRHAAAMLGACLAILAFGVASLERFLGRKALPFVPSKLAPALALAIAVVAFVLSERALPFSEVRQFSGVVTLAAGGERQRLTLVSLGSHVELYVDRALRVSALDAERYPEALVHPALLAAPPVKSALLLGGGTGLVEREVLRSPELARLVVVATDRTLVDLVARAPFPGAEARRALADPRVHVVEAEPIVWLGRASERFDVILIDVEDPIGYREGKHYTRHFYRLAAEHLAPGGVMAIQLPSPLVFPGAFGSALSTLESAGLLPLVYHAALPALGDWSFALSSPGATPEDLRRRVLSGRPPQGLRYVTSSTLKGLFTLPDDLRAPKREGNTLFDQPIVEHYAHENASRP